MENANNLKFRASGNSNLMVEARSKSEVLSETTKSYLIEAFVNAKYKRTKELTNKYVEKGKAVEQDSATLYSRISKTFHKINDSYFENEFVCGTPDIITEDSIIDIKSSYDAFTFFNSQKELNKRYYWQLLTYLWLCDKQKAILAYCLTNNTMQAILQEKKNLQWRIEQSGEQAIDHIDKFKQIEINNIFDLDIFIKQNPFFEFDNDINNWHWDIPMEDRIHLFEFERNNEDIVKLEQRIKDCRIWMNENLF